MGLGSRGRNDPERIIIQGHMTEEGKPSSKPTQQGEGASVVCEEKGAGRLNADLENLLASIDTAILILDAQKRILRFSPSAERLLHVDAHDLGKTFGDLRPGIDLGFLSGRFDEVAAGRTVEQELADHTGRWFRVRLLPYRVAGERIAGWVLVCDDIDDVRKARAAEQKLKQLYELHVQNVEDFAIFMLSPEGRISIWNPGAERVTGYTTAEILGSELSTFFLSDDNAAGLPSRFLEAARKDIRYRDERWLCRKGGVRFRANLLVTALRDEGGGLSGFSVVARDVTRQYTTEQALRASEARFRSVAQSNMIGMLFWNLDGRVEDANARWLGMTGFTVEDLSKGLRLNDVVLDAEGVRAGRLQELREHGSVGPYVRRVTRKDGTWFTGLVGAALLDAERGEAVGFLLDISEQQRAEHAVRFLSELSRKLAEHMDIEANLEILARQCVPELADFTVVALRREDGPAIISTVARDEKDNAEIRRLAEQYRFEGPAEHGLASVLQHGRPEYVPVIDEAFIESLPLEARDAVRSRKLRSYIAVPFSFEGKVLGAMVLVSTTRRFTEADYALAREVGHRGALAIQNGRLYKGARDALQIREDFLAMGSHELRTPLTALSLQFEDLRRHLPSDDENVARKVARLRRQIGRLERLIEQLLDVSAITADRLVLSRREVDLAQLAHEVVESFAVEYKSRNVALTLHAPEPVLGWWDPDRLEHVFENLLSNALKYGAGKPVDVTVEGVNGEARLTIRDQGIGIEPEALERIFGRFQRATADQNYAGFGLGLWICREVVERSGGRIEVRSRPGVETVFTIHLPRKSSAS